MPVARNLHIIDLHLLMRLRAQVWLKTCIWSELVLRNKLCKKIEEKNIESNIY